MQRLNYWTNLFALSNLPMMKSRKSSQITFKSNHCLRVMPKVAPLSLQAQLETMTMNNNEWMSYNSFQFFDGYETLKRTAGVI